MGEPRQRLARSLSVGCASRANPITSRPQRHTEGPGRLAHGIYAGSVGLRLIQPVNECGWSPQQLGADSRSTVPCPRDFVRTAPTSRHTPHLPRLTKDPAHRLRPRALRLEVQTALASLACHDGPTLPGPIRAPASVTYQEIGPILLLGSRPGRDPIRPTALTDDPTQPKPIPHIEHGVQRHRQIGAD